MHLKGLQEKQLKHYPDIVGSVVGAILSSLGKAVGFAAEHIRSVAEGFFVGLFRWFPLEMFPRDFHRVGLLRFLMLFEVVLR